MPHAENETNTTDQKHVTMVGTRFERELARTALAADTPDGYTPESWRQTRAAFACLDDEHPATVVDIWPEDGRPVLYFITPAVPGAIKIGISTRLRQRVTNLHTVVPYGLAEVWYCDGGRPLERELHRKFAAYRLPGEWFNDVPEIRAEVGRLGCSYAPAHLVANGDFEIRPGYSGPYPHP